MLKTLLENKRSQETEFSIVTLTINNLVIDYRAREWCKLPYPNHPQGCPNYNKKPLCPPQAPRIENFFDLSKDIDLIAIRFDLERHANNLKEKAKAKSKEISDKQARCVLYWQNKVRKHLKDSCKQHCQSDTWFERPPRIYTLIPEAMGVHVIRTAKLAGIPIKTHPKNYVWKIALAGYPKKPIACQQPLDKMRK